MRPLPVVLTFAALLSACMPTSRLATPAMEAEPVLAEPVSAPVIEGDAVMVIEAPAIRIGGRNPGPARRGVVTAGDIDDALNLGAFFRYLDRAGGGLPRLGFGTPVIARLTGPDGNPAPGARYTLRKPGAADPFHQGYAGPDGRITDFPRILGAGDLSSVELRVFAADGAEVARQTLSAGSPVTIALPDSQSWQPEFLDLVLVVDTTGSMGDEIAFLQRELIGITRAAARRAPGLSIRYGLIAYRDRGDSYVVRNYGFSDRPADMTGWLNGLTADGGGDYPEAAAAALQAGTTLNWRAGRGERLMIQIADAPPHDSDAASYLRAAKTAAGDGVQIFTLGASGVAEESEYLMRQISLATGGRYLFLTDDSGVGNSHAEPTVPCYQVTKLSRLLTRILVTELTGLRQEPAAGEVIRTSGSYTRGICND